MNKENLNLLAVYLNNLGNDYSKFEMLAFIAKVPKSHKTMGTDALNFYIQREGAISLAKQKEDKYQEQMNFCGTAACAVGHAPSLGNIDPVFRLKKLKEPLVRFNSTQYFEDWWEYSERVFGLDEYSDEWHWCFSGKWHDTDNTPVGAAKRIMWLIKKGLPKNWVEQKNNRAPLCYKNIRVN